MSKGIVIAKTNKNRTTKCKISFREITTSFSTTNNNIVLIDQTKEIITVEQDLDCTESSSLHTKR